MLFACVIASTAYGETTSLDNEFFAFKPTDAFAIKASGKWIAAPRLFTLGVKGKKFIIDARNANELIPQTCRQQFSAILAKNPKIVTLPNSVLNGAEVQQDSYLGKNCKVTLSMSGQRSYQGETNFESSGLMPPQDKSVSFGLIQFSTGNQTTPIEFAVAVEELSSSTGLY
jgi:hypothetical protein